MKSQFDLSSRSVLVSGGAGLLGEAFVRGIIDSGGTALVAERDLCVAEQCCEKLSALYPEAQILPVEMDITDKGSIDNALAAIDRQGYRVDALVNNAYPRNARYGRVFEEVSYDDFCENLGMNLGGYFLTSQRFIEYFRRQGEGNIVNVSSIYGVIAPHFEVYEGTSMTMPVEYAAIKAGVIHLTRYMSKYLRKTGIRVNAISPGGILDGQDESFIARYNARCLSKGMLDRSDIVGTLVFLLSDASRFINGQNIVIDDGFTL